MRGSSRMAVASLAVLVGSAEAVRPVADLDELARLIDFSHISARAGEVRRAASSSISMPASSTRCPMRPCASGLPRSDADGGEAFWLAVRGNLTRFAMRRNGGRSSRGPITPVIEDRAFIEAAPSAAAGAVGRAHLEGLDGSGEGSDGRKGKALFMPLRLALTGLDHGPELAALLPLIGPERAKARLSGQAA